VIALKRIALGSKSTKDANLPPPTSTTPYTMRHVAPRHKAKTAMQQPIALAGAAQAYKRKRIRLFLGDVIIDISIIIPHWSFGCWDYEVKGAEIGLLKKKGEDNTLTLFLLLLISS